MGYASYCSFRSILGDMEYNYTAIVLGKRKLGETDRIYTFYTKEAGKIKAVAAGVRKPRAKLAGHLETLNRSAIMVARSRGLGKIASAVTEGYQGALKADLDILGRVLRAVRQFERFVDESVVDEGLYELLINFLDLMDRLAGERAGERAKLIEQAFMFQLFDRLGYRLETSASVLSGETLHAGGRYAVSPDAGGVIERERGGETRYAFPISHDAIKLLRLFTTQRLQSLPRLGVEPAVLRETSQVLRAFTKWLA